MGIAGSDEPQKLKGGISMNNTTMVIIQMKPWAFTLIVLVAIISAIVRCRSINRRSYSRSANSHVASSAAETLFSYTAPGSFSESERRYQFDIRKTHEGYRAYIVRTPSYRNRATDGHSTHRLYDGRYYVCWDRPVDSYSDMLTIAKHWSDCSQKYIEHGTRF